MGVFGEVFGSVFGGVFNGVGGPYPDPSDVRFGVQYGIGLVGTLTSPNPSNVRSGILYGGDGTQYTGTLYVPNASGGNSWTEEMRELFYEEVDESEFGFTAYFNGSPFRCIKTPVKSAFQMSPTSFDKQARSIVDMWRDDARANGLYELVQPNPSQKRPVITISTRQYEVIDLENDDETNPVIRLTCSQLQ